MRLPLPLLLPAALMAQAPPSQPALPSVDIRVQPQPVYIEMADQAQSLNFDFLLESSDAEAVRIDGIALEAYDAKGKPILRRFVDGNGFSPSIQTIPQRMIPAKGRLLVFNPFHTFRPDVALHRLVYTFSLGVPDTDRDVKVQVEVRPQVYRSHARLALPMKGRVLVHDGHDFYGHHRRLDTLHPAAQHFGLTRNFMRYSLDLTPTDEAFQPFKEKGARNSDWYGWGQALFTPTDGTVVEAGDLEPDNELGGPDLFNPEALIQTPMKFYGNYLVIDHGHGEYSLLGHLQKGSLQVKVGDKVRSGQPVAKIGSSGSSHNPHLHFELRTGRDLQVEGLPATFVGFRRHLGATVKAVDQGVLDTGDLVERL